jgi:predicted nucleotidyltransferase
MLGASGGDATIFFSMADELRTLAEVFADWIEPVPDVPAVYLFGSRVRGDHRVTNIVPF